jgi:hypothetical protein
MGFGRNGPSFYTVKWYDIFDLITLYPRNRVSLMQVSIRQGGQGAEKVGRKSYQIRGDLVCEAGDALLLTGASGSAFLGGS